MTGTVGFDGLTNDTADSKTLCLTAQNEVVSNSGSTCTSQRFKNMIAPLDDASGLVEILKLNPVSFHYNNNVGIPGEQVGFIAEQVLQVDPRLVVLDASGTPFTVRYEQLTSLLAKAVQQIASITGTFTDNLVARLGSTANGIDKIFANEIIATNGSFQTVTAEKLCLGSRCMTAEQFNHILDMEAAAGAATAGSGGSAGAAGGSSASSPQAGTDSSTSTSATNDVQPARGEPVENPVTPPEPTGEPELPPEGAEDEALAPTEEVAVPQAANDNSPKVDLPATGTE